MPEAVCGYAEESAGGEFYCILALQRWEEFAKTRLPWTKPKGASEFRCHPISGDPCFICTAGGENEICAEHDIIQA